MLDQGIKEQLKSIFSALQSKYTFLITIHPQHPKGAELVDMLQDVAECSANINTEVVEGEGLRFSILKDSAPQGITFRAIPNGHEFNSLLLAILNLDGKGKNLPDEFTMNRIKALRGEINLTTYMTLTCTNCPEVVQTLNIMALLNPNITHEAVDGALYEEEVNGLHIQSVPTVYVNGEQFHVGRGKVSDLLDKLESRFEVAENQTVETKNFDVVMAGGGPAGATAAIYLARKGFQVAVVSEKVGGQVNETVGIENLPSVPHTTGTQLASDLKRHLEDYSSHIKIFENRKIESVTVEDGVKALHIKGGEVYQAPILMVATGAQWRKLNIPGEANYIGKGVAFCPHCDGPFYKGKTVAVIGGGNSGVEAAIDLAGICSKVLLFEFMETLKADKVLQEKLTTISNIEVFTHTQTLQIEGDGNKVTGMMIKNRASEVETFIPLDGIFVQIGLIPNSEIFKKLLEVNKMGEIVVDKNGRTSQKGIYAAGDVTDVSYKQIVISMGDAAKAALAAFDDSIRGEV